MHSLIRYSLAATAVLSMAGGVSAHPSAPREGQLGQQNRIERPAAVGGGAAAKVANAKALYFLTNDEDNAIAAIELGDNGLVTGKGATYQTGGKGANGIDGATNEKAAPDALFSQSALTVAGKHIFAVNAGSNTLSMFAIDPSNPLALQKVGEDIQLPGEFPNTVAASEKNGLVCVGMTGQKAGVACADFSAEGGLGQADGLREFQLNQTTPPVGPTNTVSQVFWSADESQLLATVKGDPEKGNNGFFSAYAVLEADAATAAAEDDQSNFVVENNGLNNLNQSDAVQGNQNLEQVKAGKAQDQANKYQNLNASAEAALGGDQYQNQNQNLDQVKAGKEQDAKNGQNQTVNAQEQANKYQNLNASAEAALGGNKYQDQNQNQDLNQVKAGKAEAEAQKAAQDLYKNKNITDPAAAAAYANAQQQQQEQEQQQQQEEGGNQANQVKAGKFRVSQEEIRSTPEGTAVLFGSVAIPGTQDVLATDASFGVAILSLLEGALAGEGGAAGQANLDQNLNQEQEQRQKEKERKKKDKQQQQQQQQQQQNEKEQDKQQKEQDKQQKEQDKQQREQDKQQREQDKQQKEQDKQQKEQDKQQQQQEKQQQKQDKQQQEEEQQNEKQQEKQQQDQDKQQQQKDQQQQKEEQQQQQQQNEKQQQQKQYAAAARLELPGQKATCWATISPLTNTAFVTDVGRNMLIEVGYANRNGNGNGEGEGELSLLNEIDLSSIGGPDLGLIDLRAAGEFVYALSPGTGGEADAAINVIHAGTKQFVQNARLTGVGAGKNSMGMAVYV